MDSAKDSARSTQPQTLKDTVGKSLVRYRPTATLLLILLLSTGAVFTQNARRQTPAPESKQAKSLVDAGDKYVDERKWKEALGAYQAAIQIDPKNVNAYIGLGDTYMGSSQWREALVAYRKAVSIAPQSADAHYALGDAYNTMRMHGDAFAPLVKAIQLDPSFAEAHHGIGYAYLSGEQYEKSLSFLKRAIALKPDYDDAHYNLALAYLHLGNQKSLDDERKKLAGLNAALLRKLDSEINEFSAAANDASVAAVTSPTPSRAASLPELTNPLPSPSPSAIASVEHTRSLTRERSVNSPTKSGSKTELNKNSSQRPELSVVLGHSAPLSALAFSSDEQILASGDGLGAIKLWNVKTGEGLRVISEASDFQANPAIGALAFSPDRRLLAAALVVTTDKEKDSDQKSQSQIGIWDLTSGRPVRTLSGLNIRVDTLAFSPDSRSLASGGASKTISLWNVASGQVSRSFVGSADVVNVIQFSADGTEIMSGNWGTSVDVWNTSTGALVRQIPGNSHLAEAILFGPGQFSIPREINSR